MARHISVSSSFLYSIYLFFFFNDTATTEIYTLSLHDALPIFGAFVTFILAHSAGLSPYLAIFVSMAAVGLVGVVIRSEEHTSELQSQSNLVCRLLLEKKNTMEHLSVLLLTLGHDELSHLSREN